MRHAARTPDDGRVSACGAGGEDVVLGEDHGVGQDLNQLLVQEAHVASAEEPNVARPLLLDGHQLLRGGQQRSVNTSASEAGSE